MELPPVKRKRGRPKVNPESNSEAEASSLAMLSGGLLVSSSCSKGNAIDSCNGAVNGLLDENHNQTMSCKENMLLNGSSDSLALQSTVNGGTVISTLEVSKGIEDATITPLLDCALPIVATTTTVTTLSSLTSSPAKSNAKPLQDGDAKKLNGEVGNSSPTSVKAKQTGRSAVSQNGTRPSRGKQKANAAKPKESTTGD